MTSPKATAIADIASELARTIESRMWDVNPYLLDAPRSRSYLQPVDAGESFLAEMHDILVTFSSDLVGENEEADDEEAVRYLVHSLMRLAVGIGGRLKRDLGIDPGSRRAAETPDGEGEPWF